MFAQSLPFPNHNLYAPVSNQVERLVFYQKLKSGLFDSSKRVPLSRVSSRNSGQMTFIECNGLPTKQEPEQEVNRDDGFYMRRCVELARTAIGCTSPNPMVGCVIVKNGQIVGEGFHPKAGQPHAEVFALKDAGELAENGTAYVSLEPCNHYGRTPPCTEALIKAKVRKVVVGMVDPNPIVDSTGVKKLQDAGIEVIVGVEEKMCKRLNEAFIHKMLTGKLFVTLRYSISLDGQLLNQPGKEAIESGGYYSKLLQEYDTIILSSTSPAQNPQFPMSKEPGANQPYQILLSDSPKMSFLEILEQCKRQGFCSLLLDLKAGDHDDDFQDLLKEGLEQNFLQKVVVEVLPVLGGGGGREKTSKIMDDLKAEVKKLTPMMHGGTVLLEGYFH